MPRPRCRRVRPRRVSAGSAPATTSAEAGLRQAGFSWHCLDWLASPSGAGAAPAELHRADKGTSRCGDLSASGRRSELLRDGVAFCRRAAPPYPVPGSPHRRPAWSGPVRQPGTGPATASDDPARTGQRASAGPGGSPGGRAVRAGRPRRTQQGRSADNSRSIRGRLVSAGSGTRGARASRSRRACRYLRGTGGLLPAHRSPPW
jgi:hypothetical protein